MDLLLTNEYVRGVPQGGLGINTGSGGKRVLPFLPSSVRRVPEGDELGVAELSGPELISKAASLAIPPPKSSPKGSSEFMGRPTERNRERKGQFSFHGTCY